MYARDAIPAVIGSVCQYEAVAIAAAYVVHRLRGDADGRRLPPTVTHICNDYPWLAAALLAFGVAHFRRPLSILIHVRVGP